MSRNLVVALSGGIGGAKLALGLSRVLAADNLIVVAQFSQFAFREPPLRVFQYRLCRGRAEPHAAEFPHGERAVKRPYAPSRFYFCLGFCICTHKPQILDCRAARPVTRGSLYKIRARFVA